MGRLLMVNGSPRGPRSNSKEYGNLFASYFPGEVDTYLVTQRNHTQVVQNLRSYSDILLVFPLYADGLPVTLMEFLKVMQEHPPEEKPTIHLLINCGFLEPEQNEVASEMVQLFCQQNGYAFGSMLWIGSGEAILTTPFRSRAVKKIQALARGIANGRPVQLKTTMPLPKWLFLRASRSYWVGYGERFHTTPQEMATMAIEGMEPSQEKREP